jgi:hypothetical protein
MSEDYASFEIWQDGMMVAGGCGPRKQALSEAAHYALVYGQDGPVEVKIKDTALKDTPRS